LIGKNSIASGPIQLRQVGLVVTYDCWKFQAAVSTCEAFLLEERSLIGGNSKASGQYDCVWSIYDWWKFQAVFLPVKVCEKIPTLGTQLRVLSTVKANPIASGWFSGDL
jgi:hypothetical protein